MVRPRKSGTGFTGALHKGTAAYRGLSYPAFAVLIRSMQVVGLERQQTTDPMDSLFMASTGKRGERRLFKKAVAELVEAGFLVMEEDGFQFQNGEDFLFRPDAFRAPKETPKKTQDEPENAQGRPKRAQGRPKKTETCTRTTETAGKSPESLGSVHRQDKKRLEEIRKEEIPPSPIANDNARAAASGCGSGESKSGNFSRQPEASAARRPTMPELSLGPDGFPLAECLLERTEGNLGDPASLPGWRPLRPPEAWMLLEPEPEASPAMSYRPGLAEDLRAVWSDCWRDRGLTGPVPDRFKLKDFTLWVIAAAQGPEGIALRAKEPNGSLHRKIARRVIDRYLDDKHHSGANRGHPFSLLVSDIARWSSLDIGLPKAIQGSPVRVQECYWALRKARDHWGQSSHPQARVIHDNYEYSITLLTAGNAEALKPREAAAAPVTKPMLRAVAQ